MIVLGFFPQDPVNESISPPNDHPVTSITSDPHRTQHSSFKSPAQPSSVSWQDSTRLGQPHKPSPLVFQGALLGVQLPCTELEIGSQKCHEKPRYRQKKKAESISGLYFSSSVAFLGLLPPLHTTFAFCSLPVFKSSKQPFM